MTSVHYLWKHWRLIHPKFDNFRFAFRYILEVFILIDCFQWYDALRNFFNAFLVHVKSNWSSWGEYRKYWPLSLKDKSLTDGNLLHKKSFWSTEILLQCAWFRIFRLKNIIVTESDACKFARSFFTWILRTNLWIPISISIILLFFSVEQVSKNTQKH